MISSSSNSSKLFEIGLVMAGAVSAGAYQGGVIDFLIEALDSWYELKSNSQDPSSIPPHDVKIKVMSGSSAGGITAAIASANLFTPFQPIENKLYESWVTRIKISRLLELADLEAEPNLVASLFNSAVLNEIASVAIDVPPTSIKRAYVAEPLHTYLGVMNLHGVPYGINFNGVNHKMLTHEDYMHFAIGNSEAANQMTDGKAIWLDPGIANKPQHPDWWLFAQSALASGAFPVALASRTLKRHSEHYKLRKWKIPTENPAEGCWKQESIATLLPDGELEFIAVDGGIVNNEPLELARLQLADSLNQQRNSRDGYKADRALILIDPFPEDVKEQNPDNNLLSLVGRIYQSLINNSRFKPDELVLAEKPNVYSRFLIQPRRKNAQGKEPSLASSGLRAFGGFLSEKFRHHDYILGRSNCRDFLQSEFVLPASNPLFDNWPQDLKEKWKIKFLDSDHLPIIPLLGKAKEEIAVPEWPQYTRAELESLQQGLESRSSAVINGFIAQYISSEGLENWFVSQVLRSIWTGKRGKVVGKIVQAIEKELEERRQFG